MIGFWGAGSAVGTMWWAGCGTPACQHPQSHWCALLALTGAFPGFWAALLSIGSGVWWARCLGYAWLGGSLLGLGEVQWTGVGLLLDAGTTHQHELWSSLWYWLWSLVDAEQVLEVNITALCLDTGLLWGCIQHYNTNHHTFIYIHHSTPHKHHMDHDTIHTTPIIK